MSKNERNLTSKIIIMSMNISNRKDSKANELLQNCWNNIEYWDIGKLNRWIGYAHCLLVAEGATTIDKLRDEIRNIHE